MVDRALAKQGYARVEALVRSADPGRRRMLGVEDDYITGAKNGVFTALMSQSFTPVIACQIFLTEFQAQ